MARLPKKGVDYFPHYVGSRDGKMLYILKSKFGNDGYAFWYQLLEMLGSEKNLCYEADNQANWLYLVATTGVNDDLAEEILDMLAELDAIDRDLWRTRRVIWCQEFADQLEPIYRKRRQRVPQKPPLYASTNENNTLSAEVSTSTSAHSVESNEVSRSEDEQSASEELLDPPLLEENYNESTSIEKKNKAFCKEFPFVEASMVNAFSKWLSYKAEKGQKYKTSLSVKTCYEKLHNYSGGDPDIANNIIENSIGMNYSGFFPLKESKTPYDWKQKVDFLTNSNATKVGINTSTI